MLPSCHSPLGEPGLAEKALDPNCVVHMGKAMQGIIPSPNTSALAPSARTPRWAGEAGKEDEEDAVERAFNTGMDRASTNS